MAPAPAHYQRLVQLVGRAFYAGECPPRSADPEAPQGPRKGTNVRTAASDPDTLCQKRHAAMHAPHMLPHKLPPACAQRSTLRTAYRIDVPRILPSHGRPGRKIDMNKTLHAG